MPCLGSDPRRGQGRPSSLDLRVSTGPQLPDTHPAIIVKTKLCSPGDFPQHLSHDQPRGAACPPASSQSSSVCSAPGPSGSQPESQGSQAEQSGGGGAEVAAAAGEGGVEPAQGAESGYFVSSPPRQALSPHSPFPQAAQLDFGAPSLLRCAPQARPGRASTKERPRKAKRTLQAQAVCSCPGQAGCPSGVGPDLHP